MLTPSPLRKAIILLSVALSFFLFTAAIQQIDLARMVYGILPISHGGTGASTAGAALTNLGITNSGLPSGGTNGEFLGFIAGVPTWTMGAVVPNVQSGSTYPIQQSDNGIGVYFSNSGGVAVTLNAPSSYSTGFYSCVAALPSATLGATITASGNINGASTLVVPTKSHACYQTDGSSWYAMTSAGF
jgi:hypothetical protein